VKNQKRNTKEFEYLPLESKGNDIDEFGDHTGEPDLVYGDPVTYHGSISAPNGYVNPTFYGRDIRYTHTLIMTNMNADIKEDGIVIYKGEKYEVRAVAPSLNVLNIALRKLTVEEETIPDPESEEDDQDGEGE